VSEPVEMQLLTRGPAVRLVRVHLAPAEEDPAPRTGDREPGVDIRDRPEPAHRDLDARGALRIAEQPVGGAQRGPVERPRGRDAEGCRAGPPEVLQRRQQPGLDHADPAPGRRFDRHHRRRRPARELAHAAEAHVRSRDEKGRGRGIRSEQRRVRPADEPPAAGGLAGVGAREHAGEADRPAGTRVRGDARRGTTYGQSGLTR
jgi:hypothetical protein